MEDFIETFSNTNKTGNRWRIFFSFLFIVIFIIISVIFYVSTNFNSRNTQLILKGVAFLIHIITSNFLQNFLLLSMNV